MNHKDGKSIKDYMLTKDGKPLKVLSTSLGIVLLANAVSASGAYGQSVTSANQGGANDPVLIEWSSEEVKSFFDPTVDWTLPLSISEQESQEEAEGGSAGSENQGGSGAETGGTTVIHTGSGFGWDDLLLYHLIFNRGGMYSSSTWHTNHKSYNPRTGTAYKPQSYGSGSFQNKPVAGSAVRPQTTNKSGTVTRRSTNSSPGGIGGKSSGLSSSGSSGSSSSSVKSSGGGFGG
ncbi:hypothetical protein AB6A23_12360 [Paenibacillus tarimensis]